MRATTIAISFSILCILATLWLHDQYVHRRDARGTMTTLQRRGPDGREGTKIIYCGEWSANLVPYRVGDAVSRDGVVYYVVRSNSIDPATDKDHKYWEVIAR